MSALLIHYRQILHALFDIEEAPYFLFVEFGALASPVDIHDDLPDSFAKQKLLDLLAGRAKPIMYNG